MPCDIEVQDASAVVANNEEAVEKTEGDRRNGEEVHGRDGFAMIAEKSQPPPTRFWISGRSLHPAGDASLRYIEAEHQKFAMDAGSTPGGVLGYHAEDQVLLPLSRACFCPTCFLTLEMKLQYRRKPALCQRTTVSGVTTMRDCFHPDQNRRVTTQKSMSSMRSLGLGCLRFSTVSCCRSVKFSRSKFRRERKMRMSTPNQETEPARHGREL